MSGPEDVVTGQVVQDAIADPYFLDPTFEPYLAARPHRKLAARTRLEYTRRVARFLAWLRHESQHPQRWLATPASRDDTLRAYLVYLTAQGRSASIRNMTLAAVNAYLEFLELGATGVAPADIQRTVTRPLSVAEQSALLATAQNRPAHTRPYRLRRARDLALVVLLLYGGLTESEVVALNDGDVVLTGVRRQVWVKSRGRFVDLPRPAHQALADYRAERAALIGILRPRAFFLAGDNAEDSRDLRRLSRSRIEAIVRNLGRGAGLGQGKGIGPGVLRATFAQHLVADVPEPRQVAYRLGQVKPDPAQINTLRALPPQQHPGRQPNAPDDAQLVLDF